MASEAVIQCMSCAWRGLPHDFGEMTSRRDAVSDALRHIAMVHPELFKLALGKEPLDALAEYDAEERARA